MQLQPLSVIRSLSLPWPWQWVQGAIWSLGFHSTQFKYLLAGFSWPSTQTNFKWQSKTLTVFSKVVLRRGFPRVRYERQPASNQVGKSQEPGGKPWVRSREFQFQHPLSKRLFNYTCYLQYKGHPPCSKWLIAGCFTYCSDSNPFIFLVNFCRKAMICFIFFYEMVTTVNDQLVSWLHLTDLLQTTLCRIEG